MEKQFLQQENKLGKKRIVDKIVVSPVNEKSFFQIYQGIELCRQILSFF